MQTPELKTCSEQMNLSFYITPHDQVHDYRADSHMIRLLKRHKHRIYNSSDADFIIVTISFVRTIVNLKTVASSF